MALSLLAVLLAGVLAACGSSGSSSGAGALAPAAAAGGTTVTISGFAFHPSTLTVKAGTKVTFTQEDGSVQHNVRSTGTGAKTLNSPNLSKGQSYTITFTKPGTYTYICSIHPFMKGTVTVT
jgi:amicyanin